MKVSVVQLNPQGDKEKNIAKALRFIDEASKEGADLVSLPEYVDFMGTEEDKVGIAEDIPGGYASTKFQEKAKEHGIYIHVGSIRENGENGKIYNTSLVINREGEIIGKYRKIHLFDIEIEGKVSAKESDTITPGDEVVLVETEFGKLGLSICYDLRFPELYRTMALQGAKVLFIPAAFTLYTGIHHWETLLKARAIENQCFVVAAGQFGSYPPDSKALFGSSMVVDPWGIAIARAPEREGVITANLNFADIDHTRQNVPCYNHRKPELYRL